MPVLTASSDLFFPPCHMEHDAVRAGLGLSAIGMVSSSTSRLQMLLPANLVLRTHARPGPMVTVRSAVMLRSKAVICRINSADAGAQIGFRIFRVVGNPVEGYVTIAINTS